jgi:type VI secretion system protein ImpF
MNQNRQNIQASILDRLIDREPGVSHEPVQRRFLNFEQGKASVIRDLENLLNTKSQILPVPPAYKEVNNSLFVYGLEDFTSENPKSLAVRQHLRQDIEKAISLFEPRLTNVTVRVEAPMEKERSVRFKISGLLILDPLTEPVNFDTYFDINKGEYTIPK